MNAVNMHEAKSRLSALVEAVESGREAEVVIARNGKPVARLVPMAAVDTSKRIGIAKGQFTAPSVEEWAAMDKEIESLFNDGEWYPGEPL